MTTILTPDPLRKSVEAASEGRCTVLYTSRGYPSYMTIVPAFKCEDLADDLGTGPHPAFIVGGREVGEMMIGTYQAIVHDGQALSLPYRNPHTTMINHDDAIDACLASGPDFHMMTNWESAALGLWCMKHGLPRGNTDYGKSHSHPEEKGMVSEYGRALTGSGPASWRHDGTIFGISDLVGKVWEHQGGLKTIGGKIIMPSDNDFNLPEEEWPDTGVRIDGVNGIQISDTITKRGWVSHPFKDIAAKPGYDVPVAIRQALIAPCSLSRNEALSEPLGNVWVDNGGARVTSVPRRFGSWYGADAGVASLYLSYVRSAVAAYLGFRLAYISSVKSV
jgi:sulfatase modifying factor 1